MFDLHRFMRYYVDFIRFGNTDQKLSRRPLFAYFVDTSHNTYLEGWIWKSIVFDYVNTHKFDFEFPVYS